MGVGVHGLPLLGLWSQGCKEHGCFFLGVWAGSEVIIQRTTASEKYAMVPRRARIAGSWTLYHSTPSLK